MRQLLSLVAVSLVCAVVVAAPGGGWYGFDGAAQSEVEVRVMRASSEQLELEIAVPGVRLIPVEAEGQQWLRLEIPGAGRIGEIGEPMLPAFRRFIEVPEGATASVQTTVLDSEIVQLTEKGLPTLLYPVQLPLPKCDCDEARKWEFSYDAAAYGRSADRPVASLNGPYGVRDHRLFTVAVSPVTYSAQQATLEVATRVRVQIQFKGGDLRATSARKQRLASPVFDSFLGDAILNPSFAEGRDAAWAYPNAMPIEYLIVTPPQFVTELQPFVEWKTSCGYNVTVATTDDTGTTTDSIKSYITGLYNGPNPPVFVLMIGDSPDVLETYITSNANGCDLYFVEMDGGSDYYPDMMIARWPIDDATELVNMREKILHYQQPTAANSAWLNRALFLAGYDYEGEVTTHEEVIAELMGTAANDTECDLWYNSEGPTTQELIDDLNTGRGWCVYSAHSSTGGWAGAPSLSTDDIPTMGNTEMYPIAHGHSCSSNEWATTPDVFGEAAVIEPSKGFVSYWGGSNSTYWDEDDWLEKGYFDAAFDEDMTGNLIDYDRQYAQIAMCYAGLTEVTLQGTSRERYYWEIYNLNGDPSLDPFTRQPVAMSVGAPAVVPPVADDFTVTVADSARGPVPVALVAVSQDGVLLGAGMTDNGGSATFPIDAPTPGSDLLVRVTAHNHLPTDTAVMVAAGSDGVVVLDGGVYRCDSAVTIDVFDDDLDGQATLDVTLSAAPSGGSVPMTLTSVPGDVVRFQGTATLGTDLTVANGDTLTVTYIDADDGVGGSNVPKTDAAVLDCAGPAIGNVAVTTDHQSMTITYTTDEPATTVVRWGTVRPPVTQVADSGLVTDHEIVIGGLGACARHWFEVESVDALGNVTVADNGSAYFIGDTAGWDTVLSESLDTDPGWVIDNNDESLGWEFGTPLGQGGEYGEPDPVSGATGSNVYGVNLAGDYDNSLTENELTLTIPSLDCTEIQSLQLRFQRWLGVEQPSCDHARIQVSTDGGSSWADVWINGQTIEDSAWSEQTYDLSAVAGGESDVRIRWTQGDSDFSWRYCGWNIDDVVIEGAVPCIICQDPPTWTSGSGVADAVDMDGCDVTGFTVSWSEATSTCASEFTYDIWVQHGATVDFMQPPTFVGVSGTEREVLGVTPGQTYAVAVRAVDEYGNTDSNTTVAVITPAGGMSGDVDGNAACDHEDATTLLGHLYVNETVGGSADVDCSGAVDAGDVACMSIFEGNSLF